MIEKVLSLEEYNKLVIDLIHVESVYSTVCKELCEIEEGLLEGPARRRIKSLIKWIDDKNGGPQELEKIRHRLGS